MNGKSMEPIKAEVQKLKLSNGDMIHVSVEEGVSLETAKSMGEYLREFLDNSGHSGVQVLITLKEVSSISVFDEGEMRKLGWVRAGTK